MQPSKRPRIFYGYWIVVAAFFCLFVWSGCAYYAFSLFVKSLEADLGWGRGEIMTAFTILFLVISLASPFVGRVVDRYGVRKVISIGAFVAGLGFALLSLINDLWFFYLNWVIVGVGMAAIGPVPATAAVSNWFKKRRGTAMGIISTGVGAGGFVVAPLIGGYFIPVFGWRVSYLALAVLTWVLVIPLALLVIRTKPADMGLHPDGVEPPEAITEAETSSSAVGGLTLKAALTTSALWLIIASFALSTFGQDGVIMSQVPYLQDIGFPVAIATTALGALAFIGAISKFAFGWLCDHISAKYAWCISLVLQVASIIIILMVRPASPLAIIWLYAVVMGLSAGAWLPAMSMLVSNTFGLVSYGAIFGVISLFQSIGTATGPLLAGYMYDVTNTYRLVFIIFLALCIVSIPAILAVRRPISSGTGEVSKN